jgi:hypothetical protein
MMQVKATVRWLFAMLLLTGCSASKGQTGFRFPVGDSVTVHAYARALRQEIEQTISRPITSETSCAAGVGVSSADSFCTEEGPPTLGAGWGYSCYEGTAFSIARANGNRAWINAHGMGATSAFVMASVSNDCWLMALQVGGGGGSHNAGFVVPFIMPEPGTVALVLDWYHLYGSTSGGGGECGGFLCEPWSSSSASASAVVYIEGENYFRQFQFSANDHSLQHIALNLDLPAGQYRLVGTDGSNADSTVGAIVCPLPDECPCCMGCTQIGTVSSATALSVFMVAYRRTIPVPLEAVRSDLDGNYQVDDGDLLSVLTEYGNAGYESVADINSDGVVDDADVLMVLQWLGTEY